MKSIHYVWVGLVAIMLCLQGCKQQPHRKDNRNQLFKQQTIDELRAEVIGSATPARERAQVPLKKTGSLHEQEAKLFDIPTPLGSKPLNAIVDSDKQYLALHYSSSKSCVQVATWYQAEMERNGWQHIATIDDSLLRTVLMFEKPQRFCTIIVQQHVKNNKAKQSCDFTVYTGIKKPAF